ncbi:MAG: hypothetical protein JNK74_22305 [Candidatus Hydrogenedentes bacterium]|nr:hypothetical protein [Candidatus Hydrogenedentota bacterium]
MTETYLQIREKRCLWAGALFWVVFSVVAVALRGVRWEETWEHALVITRAVPYPEGHPFFIYCRNVFSGQSYLSALMLSLWDSPLLINGLRNVAQLSFCTVPVYLLGMRFSGSAWGGHLAATLVLFGVHQGFQSYYPIESWPHFFATGQIGAGYALLVFGLLLLNGWRSVWFLLGLMPMVHVGQWPVIGLFAGIQWLWALRNREYARARQAVGWFVVGMTPCVIFLAVQRQFHVSMPLAGAYFAEGDAHAIWSAYTGLHDLHRAVPRDSFLKSVLAAGAVLLVAGLNGMRPGLEDGPRRVLFQTFGFALLLSGVVVSIWLVHQVLGGGAPFALIGWMPYRLMNHLAILLVPLVVGVLWRGRAGGRGLLALVLLYALLLPLWRTLQPPEIFVRYGGNLEGLIFALCGGAIASAVAARDGKIVVWGVLRLPAIQLLLLAVVAAFLQNFYPFALAGMLGGALVWGVCEGLVRLWPSLERPWLHCGTIALGTALLVSLVVRETRHREHLALQPIHQQVANWLDEHGEADAMLVTPYWDVNWLGKIRHPILADYQTAHLMSYVPALAPALKKMHTEVFGFVVDGETGPPLAGWPGRSVEEWRRLGEAYGFEYVLAPTEMELTLERVLEGRPYDLYRVEP